MIVLPLKPLKSQLKNTVGTQLERVFMSTLETKWLGRLTLWKETDSVSIFICFYLYISL